MSERERESRCHAEPASSTLRHASPHGPSHQVQQLMIRSTKTAPIPISASSTSSSTCRDNPHQSFICSPPSNNRHQTDWRKVSRSRALLPFRHVSFGLHTHRLDPRYFRSGKTCCELLYSVYLYRTYLTSLPPTATNLLYPINLIVKLRRRRKIRPRPTLQ